MFILAVKGYEEDGAFSIENDDFSLLILPTLNGIQLNISYKF